MWKKLAINLPQIWQDKTHPISKLLFPLSLIYGLSMSLRRGLYQSGLLKSQSVDVPVIIIGNITVGGTGKTPLVIWLSDYLSKKGLKVGIISRGYGGSSPQWPVDVSPIEKAEIVGDEAVLLKQKTKLPVVVSPVRVDSANLLIQNYAVDVIISDDGLQHLAINRDIEIIVIDAKRQFGNNRLLPSGPLRESQKSISADAIKIYSGENNLDQFEYSVQFKPVQFRNVRSPEFAVDSDHFSHTHVNAIAGIGYPDKFFSTLKTLDIQVNSKSFADHHFYRADDLAFNNDLPLLMTEKDAVKCTELVTDNAWYLEIEAIPNHKFINRFEQSVSKLV